MKAPQPNINNRVTFLRGERRITARVTDIATPGETVAATASDGTDYVVRNDEVLRLDIGVGIYGRRRDGSYRFSSFCIRRKRW